MVEPPLTGAVRGKPRAAVVLALFMVLVIAGVWLALRVAEGLWLPSRLQLTVDGPAPDRYQVYFDSGGGFSEPESRIAVLGPHKQPARLQFRLPATPVSALRLDPGARPGERLITSICWRGLMRSLCWTGADLAQILKPGNAVRVSDAGKQGARVDVSGEDPQLYVAPGQGGIGAAHISVARVRLTDVALLGSVLAAAVLLGYLIQRRLGPPFARAWTLVVAVTLVGWIAVRSGQLSGFAPWTAGVRLLDMVVASLLVLAVVLAVTEALRPPRHELHPPAPPGAGAFLMLFCMCMALFGSQLFLLWSQQAVQYYTLGGLLPWSDAGNYVDGALTLGQRGALTTWGCRRPIQHLALGALFGLSGTNLYTVLWVQCGMAAAASAAAGAAVWRRLGPAGAIVLCVALFLLAREQFIGTTLSENAGFVMGTLGFTLIVIYGEPGSSWRTGAVLGLFLLTLGLCARAGAFLVLPLLLLLLAWFGARGKRLRMALAGVIAVAAGFGTNAAFNAAWCPPGGAAFSNFAFVLYHLTQGDLDWTRFDQEHPELADLNEREYAGHAYRLAWDNLRDHPGRFLDGLANGARTWVAGHMVVTRGWLVPWEWAALACGLFFGIYLTLARAPPLQYYGALVLVSAVGLLVSAPFIVTAPRAFAPTIAFYALVPALGVSGLVAGRRLRDYGAQPVRDNAVPLVTLLLSAVVVIVVVAGGLFARGAAVSVSGPPPVCANGDAAHALRGLQGGALHLFAQRRAAYKANEMHVDTFRSLFARETNEDHAALEHIDGPATVLIAYDVAESVLRRVIVPGRHIDLRPDRVNWICLSGRYPNSAYHWLGTLPP